MLPHRNAFSKKARRPQMLAIVFVIATVPGLGWSQDTLGDHMNAKENGGAEAEWQLPAPATTDNLLPFYVSPTSGQSFSVDAKSLTVGTDGVVRYTMVSMSSSGAKNISYEGIRCSSYEKRLYAFGHPDGTWARARNSEWGPIAVKGPNLQHATLKDYLCKDGLTAGNADRILDAIRYHRAQPGQL
jgi:hypothetical protein